MFSLPWSRPKPERFSLENLKLLCKQLQSFPPDARKEPIITCLKELTQILIWGDQHDPMLLEHFFEQGVHWHFLEILQSKDDGSLIVQVLQTLNIMFENVRSRESLYFLLSNNYVNQVICLRYDFSNDEVLAYYIYLLRTLSFKLSKSTINFFFNEHLDDFPLYSEAIKFFNHEESMIRIAVRVITLNVYGVDDQQMQDFILDRTTTTYFSNLVWFIGNYGTTINDILLHPSEGEMSRVDYYLAEHIDYFYYINDIVELEVPKINKILISFVLNRLLRPIYIESLLPSGAQGSSNLVRSAFASPKLSPAVVLSLLLHAFHVLKYSPLVSALATTIFANQQPHVVAHSGHPHPIHLLQQQAAAGLSPGSSQASSPASTPRMYSPLSHFGSSPSSKHHPASRQAKEPALVFPSSTSSQRTPSRRSSLTDSPTAATAAVASPPPQQPSSSPVANPYKAVIFGYLSQTENDRLILPTLLLIYLTCHNTGVMADMLMGTDIYPQRLLKSRMLMGNLMSSSSLFGPGSGSGVVGTATSVPMARGFSNDSPLAARPLNSSVTNGHQTHQHPSLLQTMSSPLGSPASSSATGVLADGGTSTPTGAGAGAGAVVGSNAGRVARTESPLFDNNDEDEESRETEELLAGKLAHDVPLPPSPNPFNDSGGSHGMPTTAAVMMTTVAGGDPKSPSTSSRALSIRSHLSSSSLTASHLPMPQLPSPKVRQTQAFFPATSSSSFTTAPSASSTSSSPSSSSATPTAQAAVAALSTTIAATPSTILDAAAQQQRHHHHHQRQESNTKGFLKGTSAAAVTAAGAMTKTPPASSSSQTSIITHATMGGASTTADVASMMADDTMTAPSSPELGSAPMVMTATASDPLPYQQQQQHHHHHHHEEPSQLQRPPPPLPPRKFRKGATAFDEDEDETEVEEDEEDEEEQDDQDPSSRFQPTAPSGFPLLPVVRNREELIQRLLDIVTCVGRFPISKQQPQYHASSPHRFRIITIQVAAELLLEFVYVKGGVPAAAAGKGGAAVAVPSTAAKRRASSSAIPSVSLLAATGRGGGDDAMTPSSDSDYGGSEKHAAAATPSPPPPPPRLYENMLSEEQMQQILEAETYFRERVRRGVEYLLQDFRGLHQDAGSGNTTTTNTSTPKQTTADFQPLGVKTREVERAIQQTKLGLEKKVAGMLGDSKLLYGPPPDGDPDVDLDPDQVDDILANIDLISEQSGINIAAATAAATSGAAAGKESVGRAGRRPVRHLSMDRQAGGGGVHGGGSGQSSPAPSHHSPNNNANNAKRGRSISRNRLTAFMEDLSSGAFLSSNTKRPSSAGSSTSSLVYPVTSTAAAAASAAASASSPSTTSTTKTTTAAAAAPVVTGYGSANARLTPRTRLEKRVIRSIQWLHVLVQCRQLLSHSRNVWSAPIFAGASFGSMTAMAPSATATTGGAGAGGVASSWSSSSSLSTYPLSNTTAMGEKATTTAISFAHPLQSGKGSGGSGSGSGGGRVREETSSSTRSVATKRSERLMETLLESPDLSSSSSSSPFSSATSPFQPLTKHPLSPTLSASSSPPERPTIQEVWSLSKPVSTDSPVSAPRASRAEDKAQFIADSDDDVEVEEKEKETKTRKGNSGVQQQQQQQQRSPPTFVARPSHRLSLHGGSSALLKSAAPPALVSPSILLSPPMTTPMMFATNGGTTAGGGGGEGNHSHHNNNRHSKADPFLLSSSAPAGVRGPMMTTTTTATVTPRSKAGGSARHHERSGSGSTVDTVRTTTGETASEQPQEENAPTSIFDTRHPWHQKDDQVLGILGSLGFFGTARSTTASPSSVAPSAPLVHLK